MFCFEVSPAPTSHAGSLIVWAMHATLTSSSMALLKADFRFSPAHHFAVAHKATRDGRLMDTFLSLFSFPSDLAAELLVKAETAVEALSDLRDFLLERQESMATETAIGREAYETFLKRCALIDWSPETIVQMAKQVRVLFCARSSDLVGL